MHRGLIVLFACVLAAGCLGGSDDGDVGDDGPDGPGASAGSFSFTNILVDVGGDAETSVTVGPDGLVLACSHGGFGQPSPSWVSRDSGLTWTRLDPQPNPVVSGDCDWAVLEDGTWAIVYDTIASATVASTRDDGATWAFDYGSAVPFGGVDRPWLAAQGNTMYLAYANVMATQPSIQTLAISHDGGRTWPEHHIIHTFGLGEGGGPHAIVGNPVVDGETIRVPISIADLATGGPTWLVFAISRDGGATWTEEPVAGPFPSSFVLPVADRAPDGTMYYLKPEGDSGGLAIDVLVSRDDGETWTPIHVADAVTFPSVSAPWIDARPDGTATLAWMQEESDGRSVWAARVGPDGVLQPAQRLVEPVADTAVMEFLMVDHDADGRAFIVYPLDTGDCTQATPMQGRNAQCVYALVEGA